MLRAIVSKDQFLMAELPTWFLVDGQGGRAAAARSAARSVGRAVVIEGRRESWCRVREATGGGGRRRWCRPREAIGQRHDDDVPGDDVGGGRSVAGEGAAARMAAGGRVMSGTGMEQIGDDDRGRSGGRDGGQADRTRCEAGVQGRRRSMTAGAQLEWRPIFR
jgi:hypothetical protein